ncbi:C39 family peptidase [Lachnoclostridium edouardi]|uniref:C39 family peptidase n=1 Tax=Lachnoclostridium edouardi TaxID=1926283 RepID=UPI000C7DF687|nr:C39 family peptidase [Lachnoclostridium edouardi]
MKNQNQTSFGEDLTAGFSAAHTLRGAVKTGKLFSQAAKGTAAGGPYGAALGALWESRKHLGTIATVFSFFLILPVLFLLLLPGLVFDGLGNSVSPADPEHPLLNSELAIMENCNEISFTLNAILTEGMEDVTSRIETDFAASGGDGMEILNPYEENPVYNANLFAAQYCAAKAENFRDISISNMADILRQNKHHLYSFQRREELREITETDPETGEETSTTETWLIYTIVYNGEAYFADQVFSLTDEQKELAGNYAENLSLFLGDGLLQSLDSWTGNSIPSLGNVQFSDGVTEVIYYNQMDERYAGKPYGTDHIGSSGCGPTAMAMVVSSLSGTIVDPVEMSRWSYENGYWCKGSGSYHALIPAAAKHWNLPVSGCTSSEPQRILDALSEGKLVVAIMAKGHFTKSGHFIVLRGVENEKIKVADPGSYNRSGQLWDLSIILNEASRRAGAGGPFWIIG